MTGTATNPILYVGSTDGLVDRFHGDNIDTNSGVISRLTQSTPGTWVGVQKQDLVRGLTRAKYEHMLNSLAISQDGSTLFAVQGGHANMGAPSSPNNALTEYALSAAILEIDLEAIGNTTYDISTLDDPTRGGPGQLPENDPFGGNHGLNQARIVLGGPVQIYSPGYRNAYDLVIREDGRMFVTDNGSNVGQGNVPVGEGGSNCSNALSENGITTNDQLHYVPGRGYYGGHPNPTRGNPAGIFGVEANSPVPFALANPVECDHRLPNVDGSIVQWADSVNGITEYTASNFGGIMQGDLLMVGFNTRQVYRTKVTFSGENPVVNLNNTLFVIPEPTPLDITSQGDGEIFPGTVWAIGFSGFIRVFEPVDFTNCSGANNPALDEDNDGFNNAVEITVGTSPCNGADAPPDFDGDFDPDQLDNDDDNDGILDVVDSFAIDPQNGFQNQISPRVDV